MIRHPIPTRKRIPIRRPRTTILHPKSRKAILPSRARKIRKTHPSEDEPKKKPDASASGSKDGDEPVNQDKKPAGEQRVFQVPTLFMANGKTVELKDENEALKLMQMGANYTRKMQELVLIGSSFHAPEQQSGG